MNQITFIVKEDLYFKLIFSSNNSVAKEAT